MVEFGCRARVYVETDAEFFKRIFDDSVITVDDLLWRDAFFAGSECNGNPVFVASTDHYDVTSAHPKIACVYVSRDVDTGKMAYVYRAVCVWQGCGDKGALEFFFHSMQYFMCLNLLSRIGDGDIVFIRMQN